jgi:Protein of unknown function (DUF3386)
MRRLGMFFLVVAAWGASEARGHFLFVKIGPMAEGGRSAEVYFSEQAEAGDPKFVDKIAGTSLWASTRPGVFEPLSVSKGVDRLRAHVPPSGSVVVVGTCEYGVIARPNAIAFLLRHYPKAVAGRPEVVNELARTKDLPAIRLEIVPTFADGRLTLVVLRKGEPLPRVVFHAVDSSLKESTFTAGDDGKAVWQPPTNDHYSIYVQDNLKESGSLAGQSYAEIREFATLAFSWPLDRHDADRAAVSLFEKALSTRASWQDFPGFTADATGTVDGRAFTGKVAVADDGAVTINVDDPAASPWLEDQLASLVMHRLPPSEPRAAPLLRFADHDTTHPLGRLLTFEGGRFASSYRVKDDQITVVNRQIGRQTMTITVLSNTPAGPDKFLPSQYLVHTWDSATGRLQRVETVQDDWKNVGAFALPSHHKVLTSSDSGLSARSVTLSRHELMKK